jgi:hypothetical protein
MKNDGVLYCLHCHTRWTESCWSAGSYCPFTNCDGRLSEDVPKGARAKAPVRREKPTYPLFDALGD